MSIKIGDIVELLDSQTDEVILSGVLERDMIPDEYPDVVIDGKCYDMVDEGTTYYLRLKSKS